jgi:hypothetical protein
MAQLYIQYSITIVYDLVSVYDNTKRKREKKTRT